jgi:hypothetical protein
MDVHRQRQRPKQEKKRLDKEPLSEPGIPARHDEHETLPYLENESRQYRAARKLLT